jgi:hypothetical protein
MITTNVTYKIIIQPDDNIILSSNQTVIENVQHSVFLQLDDNIIGYLAG